MKFPKMIVLPAGEVVRRTRGDRVIVIYKNCLLALKIFKFLLNIPTPPYSPSERGTMSLLKNQLIDNQPVEWAVGQKL
jgi:hypothetical protein